MKQLFLFCDEAYRSTEDIKKMQVAFIEIKSILAEMNKLYEINTWLDLAEGKISELNDGNDTE